MAGTPVLPFITIGPPSGAVDESAAGEEEPVASVAGLQDWLKAAYVDFYKQYERRLSSLIDMRSAYDPTITASRFPRLMVRTDPEDEPEEIVFDGDLLETLFLAYAVAGWPAIGAIEQALAVLLAELAKGAPSGGTRDETWLVVVEFFRFCRTVVGLMVRDSLIRIEARCSARVDARLRTAKAWVADEARGLRFRDVEATGDPVLSWPHAPATTMRKELVDRGLAGSLATAMGEAVSQMGQLGKALEVLRLSHDPKAVERATGRAMTAAEGFDAAEAGDALQRLKDAGSALEAAEKLASSAADIIRINCPLALLVLPSLAPGFRPEAMENRLGNIVAALAGDLDALEVAIKPDQSLVALRIPGLVPTDAAQWQKVREVWAGSPCPNGVEAAVLDFAGREGANEQGWYALLSAESLLELVTLGDIEADDFDYVVLYHYTDLIRQRRLAAATAEARSRAVMAPLVRLDAGVSLAHLVVLFLAPEAALGMVLGRVLRCAGWVLTAHWLSSVSGRLSQLDELKGLALVSPGSPFDMLASTGEVLAERREVVDGLVEQGLAMLLGSAAAGLSMTVGRAMAVQAYYNDLVILLEADDGAQEG